MTVRAPRALSIVVVVVDTQRRFIDMNIDSIRSQTVTDLELVFVDNTAALDVTIEPGGAIGSVIRIPNPVRPSYFVANYNMGIAQASGDVVLALNLDAKLAPGFAKASLDALRAHPDCGVVSGKLLMMDDRCEALVPPTIDSTGIVMTLDQRHHDRGSGQVDHGQYDVGERVFGVTGAALVISRSALMDTLTDGQCFDPDFVHGREDANLCLRAQLFGWRCYYEPQAVGWHLRTIRPGGRGALPAWLNTHQVKNRFLLRIFHIPLSVQLLFAPTFFFRDAAVIAYVLLRERTSLPAFGWLWTHRKRLLAKRRANMQRRKAGTIAMASHFLGNVRAHLRARSLKAPGR